MADAARKMPRYRCHKEVWALKIAEVEEWSQPDSADRAGRMSFFDEGYPPIVLPVSWFERHKPEAGGYYVVYADGYQSFSPAQAFEEGYTRI